MFSTLLGGPEAPQKRVSLEEPRKAWSYPVELEAASSQVFLTFAGGRLAFEFSPPILLAWAPRGRTPTGLWPVVVQRWGRLGRCGRCSAGGLVFLRSCLISFRHLIVQLNILYPIIIIIIIINNIIIQMFSHYHTLKGFTPSVGRERLWTSLMEHTNKSIVNVTHRR